MHGDFEKIPMLLVKGEYYPLPVVWQCGRKENEKLW